MNICDPKFVEFHLSYSDMELDPAFPQSEARVWFCCSYSRAFCESRLMDLARKTRNIGLSLSSKQTASYG